MSSYVFSELAVKDINEICEFIGQTDIKAASNLFDDIRQKCKLVAGFPNMGKDYSWITSNLCGFIVNNYIIFYYPCEDGIEIVRVVYGKRDLTNLFEEFRD
ncbi:type II toxin-antitoxin system RelE/ParE family toxin [Richelia sinica]|uniref:type II toxin-antitoxin system RelE/ParE family toxin n=1 Tax=Richelia sinica TaxID=1357545 RepID=UPI001682BDC5|nr:type II toxin-antitoxin system RelE/ParE family toxin [Richelia sinica]MBD2665725.1 type II toxin-antitoxin system RelE/ParE family toxin [Richelia sinica FACHB-800]